MSGPLVRPAAGVLVPSALAFRPDGRILLGGTLVADGACDGCSVFAVLRLAG